MQVRSLGQEDPLEEEMATHSSILDWEIHWTEEPGGLLDFWDLSFQSRNRICAPRPRQWKRRILATGLQFQVCRKIDRKVQSVSRYSFYPPPQSPLLFLFCISVVHLFQVMNQYRYIIID